MDNLKMKQSSNFMEDATSVGKDFMGATKNENEVQSTVRSKLLAQFLKEKRVLASLSQKDVASKLGYSTSQFISNWERGISQPPLQTLRKIAEIYNVSADEVFQVLLATTIAQVEEDLKKKFYTGISN